MSLVRYSYKSYLDIEGYEYFEDSPGWYKLPNGGVGKFQLVGMRTTLRYVRETVILHGRQFQRRDASAEELTQTQMLVTTDDTTYTTAVSDARLESQVHAREELGNHIYR